VIREIGRERKLGFDPRAVFLGEAGNRLEEAV
jgi:hypothetical protein